MKSLAVDGEARLHTGYIETTRCLSDGLVDCMQSDIVHEHHRYHDLPDTEPPSFVARSCRIRR